jgi:ATP-dependent exoDNAse (exonuclease V) alpha subunit
VADSRSKAIDALVADWGVGDAKEPKNSLIFCGRNEEARDLNGRCQTQRIRAGLIDPRHRIQIGEEQVHVGDRVQLLRNSTTLDVRNGDIATVIGVNALRRTITLRNDEGGRVAIPLKKYTIREGDHRGEVAVRLGYAVTSHKGQGTTVDRAYVLMGGSMQDREISYVQLSRSRQSTRVYVDKFEAGTDLVELARKMSQSRAKDLAHDVLEESRQRSGPSLELRYSR